MDKWWFAAIAVSEIVVLVLAVRTWRAGRAVKAGESLILVFVLLGVIYDNLMLAFGGQVFGEGGVLLALSYPRYLLHAFFTPLLIVFAALSADRMNVPGYRSRERQTLFGAIAFFAIWFGLIADLIKLRLGPALEGGLLAYRHLGKSGPPLAEITTVLCLLIIGGTMQRYARWPWIFFPALFMFVMAAFFLENGVLQNIGELVLLSGCTATAAEAVRRLGIERDERKAAALREAADKRAARSAVADA